MKKECTCQKCGKTYDKKALERSQGRDSMVVLLNFCSAHCYTKYKLGD